MKSKAQQKQARLRKLMEDHNLTSTDVERLTLYKAQTVRMWMCGQRQVPDRAFRLLDLSMAKE